MSDYKIHSRDIRTLNGVVSAAFRYTALHYRSLLGTLGILAFPLIIIATYASIRTTERSASFNSLFLLRHSLRREEMIFLSFSFIIFYAGVLFHNTLINRHIIETDKAGGAKLSGTPEVFGHLREDLSAATVNYIIAGLLFFLIKIGYRFLTALASAFLLNETGGQFNFEFSLTSLYVVPVVVIAPLLYYISTAALFVGQKDKLGLFPSIKKVWRYVSTDLRAFWFASTAFVAGAGLLAKGLDYFLGIVIGYTNLLHNSSALSLISWLSYFSAVFTFVVLVVFQVAVILHFSGLEEKTEGTYLKEKIETT